MRNSSFRILALVFALFAAGPPPGHAQETLANTPTDPRLQAILKDVETLNGSLLTGEKQLTAKYISDLEQLEKEVQATGNLDLVLQVSAERKAWEAGKPTPAIDPKDENVVLGLRKLRFYFDRDVRTLRTHARKGTQAERAAISKRFTALEKTLTTEGKIDEAIRTRELRQQFVAGKLTPGAAAGTPEGAGDNTMPPKNPAGNKPETDATAAGFPLPDPTGYPPLPEEKCRIVFLPTGSKAADLELASIKQVERDDYTDVVALAAFMRDSEFAAIRADGRPVCWRNDGSKIDPRNVSAVKLWNGRVADLLWVDEEGMAGAVGPDVGIKEGLRELGTVGALYPDHRLIFAIGADGRRHLMGTNADHSNVINAFAQKENIIAATYAGENYIKTLHKDGSLTGTQNSNPATTVAPAGSVKKIFSFSIRQTTDGGLKTTGGHGNLVSILNGGGGKIIDVRLARNKATVQLGDGRWQVYEVEDANAILRSKITQALSGAIEVVPVSLGFVALLPADSVPRSGLWDVDELIAERR